MKGILTRTIRTSLWAAVILPTLSKDKKGEFLFSVCTLTRSTATSQAETSSQMSNGLVTAVVAAWSLGRVAQTVTSLSNLHIFFTTQHRLHYLPSDVVLDCLVRGCFMYSRGSVLGGLFLFLCFICCCCCCATKVQIPITRCSGSHSGVLASFRSESRLVGSSTLLS